MFCDWFDDPLTKTTTISSKSMASRVVLDSKGWVLIVFLTFRQTMCTSHIHGTKIIVWVLHWTFGPTTIMFWWKLLEMLPNYGFYWRNDSALIPPWFRGESGRNHGGIRAESKSAKTCYAKKNIKTYSRDGESMLFEAALCLNSQSSNFWPARRDEFELAL